MDSTDGWTDDEDSFVEPRSIAATGLSNDFINQYAQAVMLVELAAGDASILHDLGPWVPASYEQHFERSALRDASVALHAYRTLPAAQRMAFDALAERLNQLVSTAFDAVLRTQADSERELLCGHISALLHSGIGQINCFIATGRCDVLGDRHQAMQDMIDMLMDGR